jgi:hypothetical protein
MSVCDSVPSLGLSPNGESLCTAPEALAKFSFQSCIADFSRRASNSTTAKQPRYESPRLHHACQAQANAKDRFLRSHLRPPTTGTDCVAPAVHVSNDVLAGTPIATVDAPTTQTSEPIVVDTKQAPPTAATTPGETTVGNTSALAKFTITKLSSSRLTCFTLETVLKLWVLCAWVPGLLAGHAANLW